MKSSKIVLGVLLGGVPWGVWSQCAMCRAALASNGDTTQAEALNDGIVYLMAIPYIAVGVVGYFIYRMYTRKPQA